jgi:hypothetical protein
VLVTNVYIIPSGKYGICKKDMQEEKQMRKEKTYVENCLEYASILL